MIYFATCGRGFEKFVEQELSKLEIVHEVSQIAEGKLLFSACSCKNCDVCCSRQSLSDTLKSNCIASNYYYQKCYLEKSEGELESEFESILRLKLIEKVYLLLLFKPIKFCMEIVENFTVPEFVAIVDEIDFTNYLAIANPLEHIKTKQTPWVMCADPITCPASRVNNIEKQKRWKRTKGVGGASHKEEFVTQTQEIHPMELTKFHGDSRISLSRPDKMISFRNSDTDLTNHRFRISCRIRGLWRQKFKPNTLTYKLTSLLRTKGFENWDEDNPLMDIYVSLNDEQILIGASLSGKPLSLRPYIPHITLRSTVCHLMIQFAAISTGETILDPMCGTGTILLEAFVNRKDLRIIASDENSTQLEIAKCNLRAIKNPEYLMANAECIPLLDESVDAIVCDFPFGKKHTTGKPFEVLIVSVLKECRRVIRENRRIVFLVSKEQNLFINKIFLDKDETTRWGIRLLDQHQISLGLTPGHICIFCKTNNADFSSSN